MVGNQPENFYARLGSQLARINQTICRQTPSLMTPQMVYGTWSNPIRDEFEQKYESSTATEDSTVARLRGLIDLRHDPYVKLTASAITPINDGTFVPPNGFADMVKLRDDRLVAYAGFLARWCQIFGASSRVWYARKSEDGSDGGPGDERYRKGDFMVIFDFKDKLKNGLEVQQHGDNGFESKFVVNAETTDDRAWKNISKERWICFQIHLLRCLYFAPIDRFNMLENWDNESVRNDVAMYAHQVRDMLKAHVLYCTEIDPTNFQSIRKNDRIFVSLSRTDDRDGDNDDNEDDEGDEGDGSEEERDANRATEGWKKARRFKDLLEARMQTYEQVANQLCRISQNKLFLVTVADEEDGYMNHRGADTASNSFSSLEFVIPFRRCGTNMVPVTPQVLHMLKNTYDLSSKRHGVAVVILGQRGRVTHVDQNGLAGLDQQHNSFDYPDRNSHPGMDIPAYNSMYVLPAWAPFATMSGSFAQKVPNCKLMDASVAVCDEEGNNWTEQMIDDHRLAFGGVHRLAGSRHVEILYTTSSIERMEELNVSYGTDSVLMDGFHGMRTTDLIETRPFTETPLDLPIASRNKVSAISLKNSTLSLPTSDDLGDNTYVYGLDLKFEGHASFYACLYIEQSADEELDAHRQYITTDNANDLDFMILHLTLYKADLADAGSDHARLDVRAGQARAQYTDTVNERRKLVVEAIKSNLPADRAPGEDFCVLAISRKHEVLVHCTSHTYNGTKWFRNDNQVGWFSRRYVTTTSSGAKSPSFLLAIYEGPEGASVVDLNSEVGGMHLGMRYVDSKNPLSLVARYMKQVSSVDAVLRQEGRPRSAVVAAALSARLEKDIYGIEGVGNVYLDRIEAVTSPEAMDIGLTNDERYEAVVRTDRLGRLRETVSVESDTTGTIFDLAGRAAGRISKNFAIDKGLLIKTFCGGKMTGIAVEFENIRTISRKLAGYQGTFNKIKLKSAQLKEYGATMFRRGVGQKNPTVGVIVRFLPGQAHQANLAMLLVTRTQTNDFCQKRSKSGYPVSEQAPEEILEELLTNFTPHEFDITGFTVKVVATSDQGDSLQASSQGPPVKMQLRQESTSSGNILLRAVYTGSCFSHFDRSLPDEIAQRALDMASRPFWIGRAYASGKHSLILSCNSNDQTKTLRMTNSMGFLCGICGDPNRLAPYVPALAGSFTVGIPQGDELASALVASPFQFEVGYETMPAYGAFDPTPRGSEVSMPEFASESQCLVFVKRSTKKQSATILRKISRSDKAKSYAYASAMRAEACKDLRNRCSREEEKKRALEMFEDATDVFCMPAVALRYEPRSLHPVLNRGVATPSGTLVASERIEEATPVATMVSRIVNVEPLRKFYLEIMDYLTNDAAWASLLTDQDTDRVSFLSRSDNVFAQAGELNGIMHLMWENKERLKLVEQTDIFPVFCVMKHNNFCLRPYVPGPFQQYMHDRRILTETNSARRYDKLRRSQLRAYIRLMSNMGHEITEETYPFSVNRQTVGLSLKIDGSDFSPVAEPTFTARQKALIIAGCMLLIGIGPTKTRLRQHFNDTRLVDTDTLLKPIAELCVSLQEDPGVDIDSKLDEIENSASEELVDGEYRRNIDIADRIEVFKKTRVAVASLHLNLTNVQFALKRILTSTFQRDEEVRQCIRLRSNAQAKFIRAVHRHIGTTVRQNAASRKDLVEAITTFSESSLERVPAWATTDRADEIPDTLICQFVLKYGPSIVDGNNSPYENFDDSLYVDMSTMIDQNEIKAAKKTLKRHLRYAVKQTGFTGERSVSWDNVMLAINKNVDLLRPYFNEPRDFLFPNGLACDEQSRYACVFKEHLNLLRLHVRGNPFSSDDYEVSTDAEDTQPYNTGLSSALATNSVGNGDQVLSQMVRHFREHANNIYDQLKFKSLSQFTPELFFYPPPGSYALLSIPEDPHTPLALSELFPNCDTAEMQKDYGCVVFAEGPHPDTLSCRTCMNNSMVPTGGDSAEILRNSLATTSSIWAKSWAALSETERNIMEAISVTEATFPFFTKPPPGSDGTGLAERFEAFTKIETDVSSPMFGERVWKDFGDIVRPTDGVLSDDENWQIVSNNWASAPVLRRSRRAMQSTAGDSKNKTFYHKQHEDTCPKNIPRDDWRQARALRMLAHRPTGAPPIESSNTGYLNSVLATEP